jgi:PLP dependent protein
MIKNALSQIQKDIPHDVILIAVSKTKPISLLQEVYDAGVRHFGEDIHWHMIGHLQSNKVKYIAPYVHLIHGVESFKLLEEIDKQAKKNNRIIDCLLQFHIATEETKFGLDLEEASEILSDPSFVALENVNVVGVMGMASFTSDQQQVRQEFRNLHAIFMDLKSQFFTFNKDFSIISMGMSGDYQLAIDEGSTMVRVGSAIFGGR